MKKLSALIGLGLCGLLCLFLLPSISRGQVTETEKWGLSNQGLQMSVSMLPPIERTAPELQVTLRNSGDKDAVLNLGMMLANGKVQFPTAIRLLLVDAAGKERPLRFIKPNVAGRVDDYVVPLRVGSMYSVRVKLSQFYPPSAKRTYFTWNQDLQLGQYRISARFEGKGASRQNLDMQGVALMNFWTGKLQSNQILFKQ